VSTVSIDDPYAQALEAVAGTVPPLDKTDPGVGQAH
jgi:hypothetical protein